MKYIEKLLQGTEVEWTTLGDEKFIEIANTSRRPVKASNRIAGNTPYYGANNIQDYVEGYTHDGTYVLVAEDGTTSVENYSVQWATGKFWANNHVHVLRGIDCVNSRFLFHYLRIVDFAPFLTGGGRAKLTKKDLIKVPIPIPPLHVQQEIVRILDKFTELETELETELALRKQQYERYRDQLLSPDKGLSETEVEWKKLEEVAELRRGRVISKGYLNENAGLYPVYSSQTENMGEIGRIRTFDFDQESITWTTDGAKAGTVFHRKGRFSITNVCGLIKIRDIQAIGYRYLYYWLSIEAKKHVYLGMGNPKLMSNQIERVPIPIPPLHVQQEIVRILDKFTELETKLETELELRKQQYAYYRDQLLSFER